MGDGKRRTGKEKDTDKNERTKERKMVRREGALKEGRNWDNRRETTER